MTLSIKTGTKTKKLVIKHTTARNRNIKNKIHTQTKRDHQIKVIAYNISNESMTGRKPDWPLCSNNTDPSNPRHNSVCISNVARVLEENPADFILLQEADSYAHIIKEAPSLTNMRYEYHESSKDKIITFWDKKYNAVRVIRDEFEPGRPWMAILYSNGWCVINVHFGHYIWLSQIKKMRELVKKIKKELKFDRLIIGGDFNYDIKKLGRAGKLLLENIVFHYHRNNLLTCCIRRRVQYDHIIDTSTPLLDIQIPNVEYMASDHKPILATLAA